MPTITARYSHCRQTAKPERLGLEQIWAVARQVRDQLCDSGLERRLCLERIEEQACDFEINDIAFEVSWDLEHRVATREGRRVMGVTEYDPGSPDCVFVSVSGGDDGMTDTLLRSTIAHELGHVVFDAPGWMVIAPSQTDRSAFATVPGGRDPREVRANEFMGGLLVPPSMLRVDWQRLARRRRFAAWATGSRVFRGAPAYEGSDQDADCLSEALYELAECYGVSPSFIGVRLARYDLLRTNRAVSVVEEDIMSFGAWIRAEREKAGISLKDFAASIVISPAYWSRIERGMELAPKNELILAACARLGLSTDRAFAEARRLPPDMEGDLAVAISVYRDFKAKSGRQ